MREAPSHVAGEGRVIQTRIAGYRGKLLAKYNFDAFVKELHTFLARGRARKKPVSTAADRDVYRWCPLEGDVFYVKRYQMRGVSFFIRTLAGVNKAQKAWRIGRKMRRENIGTPLPVALLKRWRSLFRSEYMGIAQGLTDAVSLDEAVARVQGRQHFRQKRRLIADVAKYMADLHLHKFYHSDFTADNVLVRERNAGQGFDINLIDLDAVRTIPWISARRREKNLERMGRNFLDLRMISTRDRARFLKHYIENYPLEKRPFRRLFRDVLRRMQGRMENRHLSFTR